MANNYNFLLAGFGGQGILFAGKVIAYTGMIDGKEPVSYTHLDVYKRQILSCPATT